VEYLVWPFVVIVVIVIVITIVIDDTTPPSSSATAEAPAEPALTSTSKPLTMCCRRG
jgi:hypothetical protein